MRKIEDLEKHALKFWPTALAEKEKSSSVIPRLIETQDKFISLLNLAEVNPFAWKKALTLSKTLPPNLFLKHLIVLSDLGGEKLMRFKKELPNILNENEMSFIWEGSEYTYKFQTLEGTQKWSNTSLKVDGKSISFPAELSSSMEDVINLIMFGGLVHASSLPKEIEEKCILGAMLGKKAELDKFVRQRYIWVSRITGGATSNMMGQLAQNYIAEYLKNELKNWDLSNTQIPEISQNERTPMKFDIVAKSPIDKYCAIEVSFQVTTNSVIERKAGQAQSRQNLLHKHGHKIAYIIDGAGNFERKSALTTLCQYSDCTVSFSDNELDKLVIFLKDLDRR